MRMAKGGTRRWFGLTLLAVAAGLLGALVLRSEVSLLTTQGSSMFPRFRTGDLAITVRSADYRVGDIVAYRAEPNNAIVLHRIVAIKDGRYTFKGDNNGWKDPTNPTVDRFVGKLWVRIPRAGIIVDYSSAPGRTALLIVGVVLVVAGGGARRRSRRNETTGPGGPTRRRHLVPPPDVLRDRLVTAASSRNDAAGWLGDLMAPGAALAVAVLLAGIAFTTTTTRTSTEKRTYTQEVTYGYTATAPSGTTYPDGTVTTGSPIFLRLVQQLHFQIGYELRADDQVHNTAGMYSVDAVLSGIGTWTRTLPLQPPTRFSGPAFSTDVMLDIPQIQALVAATEAETGAKGSNVIIDIVPKVITNTFAGDVPLSATFDTPMRLKLTPLDVTPVDEADALATEAEETYRAPVERVRNLTLLGRSIAVSRARLLTGLLFLGTLGWFLSVLRVHRRLRTEPEAVRLAHRYQSAIVEITSPPDVDGAVEVADLRTMAKIAERGERLILHYRGGGQHVFFVEDGPTAYFLAMSDSSPPPGVQSVAPEPEPVAAPPPVQHPSPVPTEPAEPRLAGLFDASDDGSLDGSMFHALLGVSGLLDVPDPGTPPPYPGTPPPYAGAPTPAGDIVVGSLDEALRLTPISPAERAELGWNTELDQPRS